LARIVDNNGGGRLAAALALALLVVLAGVFAQRSAGASLASPGPTKIAYGVGKIVPIPASIPHETGDMVDRRILPDLRWIAARFPIYVTDGYSGRLPQGGRAGCHGCHTKNSDHHNGLAVDIVSTSFSTRCDASWRGITRLARWAEPRQNRPNPPFRWVGYTGDAGHGCGHHLHLSWNHAEVPEFAVASWVEVLRVGRQQTTAPKHDKPPPPPGPAGGLSPIRAVSGGIGGRAD
jgi:hypothetical protein